MGNLKLLVLLVLASFIFVGCPDRDKFNPDSIIIINNNSNIDIMYDYLFSRFPDTTLIPGGLPFYNANLYGIALIKAMSSKTVQGEFIDIFKRDSAPIMLFLFSRDTIDQVPWEKIRDEYKILRRYDLTKEMLDSLNWTITYP